MDDVPTPITSSLFSPPSDQTDNVASQYDKKQPMVGSISGKETEGIAIAGTELPLQDIGKEIELPKEVVGAGVKIQPTADVPISPSVQRFGVKPTGPNITISTSVSTVPLTYDQINKGLNQGITTSWRWLAEWCVRRLKQLKLAK